MTTSPDTRTGAREIRDDRPMTAKLDRRRLIAGALGATAAVALPVHAAGQVRDLTNPTDRDAMQLEILRAVLDLADTGADQLDAMSVYLRAWDASRNAAGPAGAFDQQTLRTMLEDGRTFVQIRLRASA
jgi:hypothetical protein